MMTQEKNLLVLEKPLPVLAPPKKKHKIHIRLVMAAVLALSTAALSLLGAYVPAFAGGFFYWSKTVCAYLALPFSLVPFSVAEWLLYGFAAWLLFYIARFIVRVIRAAEKRPVVLSFFSTLLLVACTVAFLFTALFGVGYKGPSLASRLKLDVKPRPAAELAQTAGLLLENANKYADLVPRDETGAMGGGFSEYAEALPGACRQLAGIYPVFQAPFYPEPKWVTGGRALSALGISGIFIPFTAEANVNPDTPATHLPFTMSHEAAHRLGVAKEDEANFTAFLACINSEKTQYIYSGYLSAYMYAWNALYKVDRDAARALSAKHGERLNHDLTLYFAYLARYEGPAQEAGAAMNNMYLRSMGQPDGVQSYGRMVDLLCAWTAALPGE